MKYIISSSDPDESGYEDDDTYKSSNSSEDDSFESATYEKEDKTDLTEEEEDKTDKFGGDSLGSSSYQEEVESGSAEEEVTVNSTEQINNTEKDETVEKEDNTYETGYDMADNTRMDETGDDMADNTRMCEMISTTIDSMQDHIIGNFNTSNQGLVDNSIVKMHNIRAKNEGNDFRLILDDVTSLMNDELFLEAYRNFRAIYEFILHMFDIYEVPIDETVPADDDRILRKTMKKAAGKKTKFDQKTR